MGKYREEGGERGGLAPAKGQLYGIWLVVSRRGELWLAPRPPEAVEQMEEGQHRVGQQHPWTAMSHHRADAFTLRGFVAMDRTVGAGGLAVLKRAVMQSLLGIGQEIAAVWARFGGGAMVIAAVAADHGLNSAGLAPQAMGREKMRHGFGCGEGACWSFVTANGATIALLSGQRQRKKGNRPGGAIV